MASTGTAKDSRTSPDGLDPPLLAPLEGRHVAQAESIEREAFPTLWPPTPFGREVRNRTAAYLATVHAGTPYDPAREGDAPEEAIGRPGRLRRWAAALGGGAGRAPAPRDDDAALVSGFVGIWFMADEAHITSIAVRSRYQGRGFGELLLLGALWVAQRRGSRTTTLEVRVSNAVAQALYSKYGFKVAGVRKRYYSDNHEDAYIMSTGSIRSPDFHAMLDDRRHRFEARYGTIGGRLL